MHAQAKLNIKNSTKGARLCICSCTWIQKMHLWLWQQTKQNHKSECYSQTNHSSKWMSNMKIKKAMHLMRITTLHFCNIASNTRDTFCPSPRMCCTRDSKNTIAMLLNTIVSKIYKPMICSGLKLVFCKQIDFLVYVFDWKWCSCILDLWYSSEINVFQTQDVVK